MFAQAPVLVSFISKNPIAEIAQLKTALFNLKLDFSTVTVEMIDDLMAKMRHLYTTTYNDIAELKSSPSKINFVTTMQPIIDLDICLQKAKAICNIPKKASPDESIRNKSKAASDELEKFIIECQQRLDVFEVFVEYQLNTFQVEKPSLHQEDIRYVEETMRDAKRNGLYIKDPVIRSEIKSISKEISVLCNQFEHNLAENKSSFIMSTHELEGLSKNWLANHEIGSNQYKVVLEWQDFYTVLRECKNRETRRKIHTAYYSRCEKENLPILKRILQLRQRKAELLGYESHADYAAELRMAKNAKNVKAFLNDMTERFEPLLQQNLRDLTQFARTQEKDPEFVLQHFDLRYYQRWREEVVCNIDMDKVKEYFPQDHVINSTLELYGNLLGLNFVRNPNAKTWDKEVIVVEVFNRADHKKMGNILMDLRARPGKVDLAQVNTIVTDCDVSSVTKLPNQRQESSYVLFCNLPKEGNLAFNDVKTFFHEFGHAMHFICAKPKLPTNKGGNVERDFVEAPSQMLENWCFEPKVLKVLSSHYLTGEPLPNETANKLKKVNQLHAGYFQKRQLVLASFDFMVHSLSSKELSTIDLKEFYLQLENKLLHIPTLEETCFPVTFAHLVGDYDAGYYGYMQSETFAAQMYKAPVLMNQSFKDDPLSPELGAKYRKVVLEPGASQDSMLSLTNFLGGPPNLDAFLEKCGLEPELPKVDSSALEAKNFRP